MVSVILLIMGFIVVFVMQSVYFEKKKNEREWLKELQWFIHLVERDFMNQCDEITEKYFPEYVRCIISYRRYTSCSSELQTRKLYNVTNEYYKELNKAKEEFQYIASKVAAKMDDPNIVVPGYLAEEYRNNIERIYTSFWRIEELMYKQIENS